MLGASQPASGATQPCLAHQRDHLPAEELKIGQIITDVHLHPGAASGMQAKSRLLGQSLGAAIVALTLGLFPQSGTRESLVFAACAAGGAAVVGFSRLAGTRRPGRAPIRRPLSNRSCRSGDICASKSKRGSLTLSGLKLV